MPLEYTPLEDATYDNVTSPPLVLPANESVSPAPVAGDAKRSRIPLPFCVSLTLSYVKHTYTLAKSLRTLDRKDALIHVNHVGCEFETIAARLAGFQKIVTTVHNLPGYDSAGMYWLRRWIERLSFACADRHICVSQATFDAWHERVGLKSEVVDIVYNGMSVPDYSGFDRSEYRRELILNCENKLWIGMCARLHPMKGHSVLLGAFAQLLQLCPQDALVLVIAGSGPLDAALKQLAEQLGIAQQVHFLGHRTDAIEFASAIDINVLPSVHSETLGYSLIEAMFAGRPSVVSDIGGMKELVTASQSGCVVPAGDVSALAQAFANYVQNSESMLADGASAQRYAMEHLTAEKMAEATLEVYSKLH